MGQSSDGQSFFCRVEKLGGGEGIELNKSIGGVFEDYYGLRELEM